MRTRSSTAANAFSSKLVIGLGYVPTLPIERARSREVYRTTFSSDQRRAIVAEQPDLQDRLAVRLLLEYGLRKGALRAVRSSTSTTRRRLTIFTKGQKVRELPLRHPGRSGSTSNATSSTRSEAGSLPACAPRRRSRSTARMASADEHAPPGPMVRTARIHGGTAAYQAGIVAERPRTRRAHAQGPAHRWPAGTGQDRQPQGCAEAPRATPQSRRRPTLPRLGHRPACRHDGSGALRGRKVIVPGSF